MTWNWQYRPSYFLVKYSILNPYFSNLDALDEKFTKISGGFVSFLRNTATYSVLAGEERTDGYVFYISPAVCAGKKNIGCTFFTCLFSKRKK